MVEKATALTLKRIGEIQWRKLFNMMYIEPVIFMLVFAHALSGTIMRNQIIYQACITVFNYNESTCALLGTKNASATANAIETEIQPYVANLFMLRTLLESIVPALCGVFVGSWSDHYGRKPLLLISMIGFSCTYIIAATICEIARFYPVNPWYYILTAVPHSLLGGNCVFTVAAFCFISDVTDLKMRPYRMIGLEAFIFVGLTMGSLLSSYIYEATNATIIFIISGVLVCGATVFIAVCVPESLHIKIDEDNDVNGVACCESIAMSGDKVVDKLAGAGEQNSSTTKPDAVKPSEAAAGVEANCGENEKQQEEKVNASTTKADAVKPSEAAAGAEANYGENEKQQEEKAKEEPQPVGLFSYVHIKEMVICVLRQRPFHDRSIIWLVTGTMFLAIFVMDGAMTVFYLFVREKFHWSIREFTFYETVSHLVTMVGAIVGVIVMRKVLKLSIVTLALVALFSDVASALMRGLASEWWHLYVSIALGLFRSVGSPMCRTIVSNIVPANELGKIFSIKNVLQSIAPFLASPLYTFIYKQSLGTFPGLFNIVSAGLYSIGVVLLVVVFRYKLAAKEHYAAILK